MELNRQAVYSGNEFFRNNIPIFLNIASEQDESSCCMHRHDFIEIAYVYSGKGFHLVGNERHEVCKGSIFIINYDIPHVFVKENVHDELIVYNCTFKPEFIDASLINTNDFREISTSLLFNTFFIEDAPAIKLELSGKNQGEIEQLYKKMHLEYFNMPKGYINILRSCLIELLTRIFRLLEEKSDSYAAINMHKLDIINKAVDFLKENYASSTVNMDEVIVKTFLSRSYFSKLFKEVTGQNFTDYLQNLRISEACSLLESTDKKVTEILSDVGFKDIKHFNRLFKKITGKTPSQYRKG